MIILIFLREAFPGTASGIGQGGKKSLRQEPVHQRPLVRGQGQRICPADPGFLADQKGSQNPIPEVLLSKEISIHQGKESNVCFISNKTFFILVRRHVRTVRLQTDGRFRETKNPSASPSGLIQAPSQRPLWQRQRKRRQER